MQNVNLTFKEERLKEEIDKLIKELKKEISIPGFRKGKAPTELIKVRFKDYLKAEGLQKLIQEEIVGIIEKYEPFIYSPPMIKKVDEDKDGIHLEVSLDVPPELSLDLSEIELKGDDEEIDIKGEIEKLREINSELRPVEREVRKGDIVTINLKLGEEEFSNYTFEVREDDFSKKLLGLKVSDGEKELEVEIPEDFPIKDSKNKKRHVRICICEIKEKVKPELNDDFAKDLGFRSLVELKESLKRNIQEERKRKDKEDEFEEVILDKVLEKVGDFEVSPGLLNLNLSKGLSEEEAKVMAKKLSILDSIALKEKMEITEAELDQWMDRISESDEFEEYGEEAIRFVKQSILRRKTMDFLIEKAKKEESKCEVS
ncbi:MAG: trigger factor [candidate division WOR-3 bacterium]